MNWIKNKVNKIDNFNKLTKTKNKIKIKQTLNLEQKLYH